ncbi:MAG: response regulator transcription factor [Chloroflexi bacterium]|nr:response regulator transcription factor [Chloroflexota bacterium]MBI3167943.1 response regulator transcription factor [Chloroflexota bacterium]
MITIKILVVDDHPMMRDALKMSLASEKDMKVIGEGSNGREVLKLLESLSPDVILMDLMMPEMNGVEAITQIFKSNPQARILVLTSMEDEEHVMAAIQAGALGYFPKTAPRQYLLEAIRKVADGAPYMPAGITKKLFDGLRNTKTVPQGDPQITITARQREIMMLMAEGKTDEEIASILHLQESTVRSHMHQIGQRLGTENRSQIVAYVHNHLKS